MNYDHIVTFLSLVETKNFNRTAELLFVSQPTITSRIKALESYVTQPLFIRTNKYVELTPAGKKFLPYAMDMYNTMRECRTAMNSDKYSDDSISFSAPASCWDYGPLAKSVLNFAAKHTNITLDLLRNISVDTLSLLQSGKVDCGVVYVLPSDPDYTAVPYFSEELLLVASPKMDLTPQGNFLKDQSSPPPFLVNPRYSTLADQLVEDSLYMLPTRISCDHPTLYCQLVKQGFGIGLLQTSIADSSLASGELVVLDCDYNKHPLLHKNYIVFHRSNEKRLQGLVEQMLGDLKNTSFVKHSS